MSRKLLLVDLVLECLKFKQSNGKEAAIFKWVKLDIVRKVELKCSLSNENYDYCSISIDYVDCYFNIVNSVSFLG